jgi:hypothetical protein
MSIVQAKAAANGKKAEWSAKVQPRGFGQLTPVEYVEERFNAEIDYYSKSASRAKKRYLQMRAITVVGGALVPVLVNVHFPYVDILTTAISLVVVLFVSIETVYRYREQWTNYRTAEQNLRNEYFGFTSNSGIYSGLDEATAFTLFVNRIEQAIEAESASTLRVMTTLTELKAGAGAPAQVPAKS